MNTARLDVSDPALKDAVAKVRSDDDPANLDNLAGQQADEPLATAKDFGYPGCPEGANCNEQQMRVQRLQQLQQQQSRAARMQRQRTRLR